MWGYFLNAWSNSFVFQMVIDPQEQGGIPMYYSNGNYEAFARPVKPEGVDKKSAYLAGSGLASLAAACFLVRDGQMKGEHIHILEELSLPGGACDGIKDAQKGFIIRGGREMEDRSRPAPPR